MRKYKAMLNTGGIFGLQLEIIEAKNIKEADAKALAIAHKWSNNGEKYFIEAYALPIKTKGATK